MTKKPRQKIKKTVTFCVTESQRNFLRNKADDSGRFVGDMLSSIVDEYTKSTWFAEQEKPRSTSFVVRSSSLAKIEHAARVSGKTSSAIVREAIDYFIATEGSANAGQL